MNPSIRDKLERITDRCTEITALLADPQVQEDRQQLRELDREYAQLESLMACYRRYRRIEDEIAAGQEMLADPELADLAREEIAASSARLEALEPELQRLLIPPDPHDQRNVFLEIRAGTGGAEAALFAADLARMYLRFAELRGWSVEPISASAGELGGYKETVLRISGGGIFSYLKFEAGTHRVQRVPDTESQGRVHTSACTVAVLPEAEAIDAVELDAKDLRIDTYRASGAGGQHVNKTDSAVRITHRSSGMVVECQDERSQHKNKARALSLLQSKLLSQARGARIDQQARSRRLQVGSGDRSERIRTYNFPQNRVTDHRINLTLYKLNEIMAGQMDRVIDPLIQEHQAQRMIDLMGSGSG